MGKIIAFANQKGGSGKTTVSANLAVLWANSGYKVAVIDADAQQSLSYWFDARKKYYGDEPNGINLYPFDPRSLRENLKNIKNLDDNPLELQKMSKNSSNTHNKFFTPKIYVQRLITSIFND